jgi:hypothetical protein
MKPGTDYNFILTLTPERSNKITVITIYAVFWEGKGKRK